MNAAVISGIRKGDFSEAPNGGVRFTLINVGKQDYHDEFEVVAYGQSAAFLEHNSSSGDRVVVFGRVSSDKLGTDNFHHVINVTRVLSVSEGDKGVDFNYAVVSGSSDIDAIQETERSKFARISTRNIRTYQDQSFTNFVNATAWAERADELESSLGELPAKGVPMVYEGMIRPRTYDKDGETVHKIDLWVQEYQVGGSGITENLSPTPKPTPKKQYATKSASAEPSVVVDDFDDDDDGLPF